MVVVRSVSLRPADWLEIGDLYWISLSVIMMNYVLI